MGYKNNDPCWDKADDDEPLFVGLGRDPLAAVMTLVWAALSEGCQPDGQVTEAQDHSARMMAYCLARNPGRRAERLTPQALSRAVRLLQAMRDELEPPLWQDASYDDAAQVGAIVLTGEATDG